jgi:hypothetical protein
MLGLESRLFSAARITSGITGYSVWNKPECPDTSNEISENAAGSSV